LDGDIWQDSIIDLLDKLQLLDDAYLKRAAIFQYDFAGFIVEFQWTLSDKLSDKTSDKVLELMRNQPNITIKQLSVLIGIATRVVEFHIQNLKKEHKIARKGGKKGGEWVVNL
jgi:predicted HTH transcriptional regulator